MTVRPNDRLLWALCTTKTTIWLLDKNMVHTRKGFHELRTLFWYLSWRYCIYQKKNTLTLSLHHFLFSFFFFSSMTACFCVFLFHFMWGILEVLAYVHEFGCRLFLSVVTVKYWGCVIDKEREKEREREREREREYYYGMCQTHDIKSI